MKCFKMNIRSKNLLSCLFFRPWLMVPFGMWIAVSVIYYWWLISRISLLETQNKVFKTQLRLSQSVMKQMSVDSGSTYEVPVIPDAIGTLCETVHIAIVCMGKCTRLITPMLKSMLHHRQNPIHFHLVVDTSSQHTFTKLFDTWDLPDVKYSCYNAEERLVQVQWIPNSHYSGTYSLVKLLFPDILPDTLSQAIVVDSDLTFMCDVAELWAMFRNMTDDQFIGLVENESNWYLDTAKHWPAIGRGYNTGVMLLDLKKIRTNTDWTRLWQDAVNDNIDRLKKTTLADQDVINGVIKKEPRFVYNISCQYNVQMSTQTLAKSCYGENMNNVKIIHWNSPGKYNVRVRDADYFRDIHQTYVNFDGNLLREKLHRCSFTEPVTYKMNHSDLCLSFRAAQRVKLRTHLYYMDYSYVDVDSFDVTLVLQLSMDRLQFLERLVKYWEGPLSVAIYLSDCELTKLESFIRDWSDTLSSRKNIGYHLVFKHDDVHYPVNYLRNVALENVNTPYVFLMDVDFVPMVGLYEHLRNAIQLINPYPQKKRYRAVPPRSKAALLARLGARGPPDVAPFRAREWPRGHRATNYTRWATANAPYEALRPGVSDVAPFRAREWPRGHRATNYTRWATANAPYEALRPGVSDVAPFRAREWPRGHRATNYTRWATANAPYEALRPGVSDVAPFRAREWPRGHRATNYTRWATANAPYEVEWQTDYEPYLVVHRSVPKYDTRFSGFGWNKVEWQTDYEPYLVVHRSVPKYDTRFSGFGWNKSGYYHTPHTPHAPSHDITAFRADPHYRMYVHTDTLLSHNTHTHYRAVVLPGAFVLHTPHAPSHDITAFRADPHSRMYVHTDTLLSHNTHTHYRAVVLPGAFVLHTPHAPSHDITAFRADPHYRMYVHTDTLLSHNTHTHYRAVVLPGAFVLHTPHAPSHDITAFRADPHYRICLALLKQEFMDDLKRKYNVTFDDSSKSDPLYLGQAKSLILNQAKDIEVN
ncbi:unnamed protein product [Chrysodeixis includens]|uniref:Glycosyltransferase-like protein LARGE2 n=1 Tax=Chrysodeixis includens TaxID=689277 RepID=A0A9P0BVS1_CHRIL|nr:unnamed protein product [Chrysodeixis includens]